MRFSEALSSGGFSIRAYAPGLIQVGERRFEQSLVVMPHRLLEDWPPRRPQDLTPEHLDLVLELEPEIILLGTGASLVFPDPACQARAARLRVGVEVMDTGAACRTYNILMAEGRRVAAALLPP